MSAEGLAPAAPKSILLQEALDWLQQQDKQEIPTELLQKAFFEVDVDGMGTVQFYSFSETLQCCGGANVLAQCGVQVRDIFLEIDRSASGDMDMYEFVEFFRKLEELYKLRNVPGVSYVFATLEWPRTQIFQLGNKFRLDDVISECALIQDQYDISIIDNDSDGAVLPSLSDMKANGNYTITRAEGDVTITVIWNGSKKEGQIMTVFEAIRYCEKKGQYLKSVPEGRFAIADDVSGVALSALSDMKKRGNYTVTITNPWAARRFWQEEVDGEEISIDPAMDAERREYVTRRAAQKIQGWAAGADARRNFQHRRECAIFIQSVWRGNQCRKRLREIKAISSEWQTKSLEAKCFRLAEKVYDLREENKSLRSQIEDCQDFYDDELLTPRTPPFCLPQVGCTNLGSYTPPGGLPMDDLGLVMLEDPGRELCAKQPPNAFNGGGLHSLFNWRGLRSAKQSLDNMENQLLECQLDFDFYSDSELSDAAKQIFARSRDRVAQLESEVAAAKTKLEAENKKWFNKGGVRSACHRLVELEDRLITLSNLLSPDLAFQHFDADCTGTLDHMELRALFQELEPGRWSNDQIDQLFDAVDQNRNNSIEFHEFMSWAMGNE